ncbi:hypothetical protein [Streptomyces sp. AC550_RSS872]
MGIWGVGGLGAHGVRIARLVEAAPVIAVDPLSYRWPKPPMP